MRGEELSELCAQACLGLPQPLSFNHGHVLEDEWNEDEKGEEEGEAYKTMTTTMMIVVVVVELAKGTETR